MDNPIPFDLLNSPLEGMNLIEASAGTGKTFNLAGLFIRLILEKGFLVNEILVMTFTEGATAELKERIRKGLQAALRAVTEGRGDEDFYSGLVTRHKASREKALLRINDALRRFDEASIYTIHGFCGRILQENIFETGLSFGMELVTDEKTLKEEIFHDFWRRHFYHVPPLFFLYAQAKDGRFEDFQRLVMDQSLGPSLTVLPDAVERIDTTQEENAFLSSFHTLQEAWRKGRPEVEQILTSHESLNRNKYRKASIPIWLEEMDDLFRRDYPVPVLPPSFSKFTSREIRRSLKREGQGDKMLEYPFFKRCDRFQALSKKLERAFAARLLETKKDLLRYMSEELATRKESRCLLFFDDLLSKLWQSLSGKGGKGLLSQIRKQFQAALIDEFQDTDPLQYAIFKKIFDIKGKILFMIGDPKQAIYGFRGADVFAYMKGASDAQSRFGLPQNWRSTPELIMAVNAIFGNRRSPFLYKEISFSGAQPAAGKDIDHLVLEGAEASSFHLWFCPRFAGRGEKPIPKEVGRRSAAEAVAWEIGRLMHLGRQGRALIGKRNVNAGDIAVLVRKNRDAALMQQHLSELGIPSVLHSTGNLFETREARELERVLAGISGAMDRSRLITALSTDILGSKGEALDAMMKDTSLMEAWVVKMREYHESWSQKGFYPMFRRVIMEEHVLPRLLSYPDGERRATNLLHLAEQLHQYSLKERLSIEGLIKWLRAQRLGPQREEHLLRLESDEKAVKVMTIHKSKGLEFPIVFCPFSWDGSKLMTGVPFLFHDPARDRRLTLDLGSAKRDENRLLAEEEILAENLRLLYVALTRAKVRCYLLWGRFNQSETSAPAYLFHNPKEKPRKDIVGYTEKWVQSLDSKAMLQDLNRLKIEAKGHIHVSDLPNKTPPLLSSPRDTTPSLVYRSFEGEIDKSWRIASFSSLVSGMPVAVDWADRDEQYIPHQSVSEDEKKLKEAMEERDLFSFPRGTMAGIFFHDLLEHLDFTEQNPAVLRDLVERKLQGYGLDPEWRDTVVRTINHVVSSALKIDEEEFSLSQISPQQRLNELAFYYPLKCTSSPDMFHLMSSKKGRIGRRHFPETLGRVTCSPSKGFMKGYIDLVFEHGGRYYIVDWKSNYLGNHIEDYGPEALANVMNKGHYDLQCHIYALALHQYLIQRLSGYQYNDHFGGAFYIFLRGLAPVLGRGYGIYGERPSEEQMNTWVTDLIP